MPHKLIDTHAHYDNEAFDADRSGLLAGLPSADIACVINAGSDAESSETCRELAESYGYIRFTAGIHPHNAEAAPHDFESEIARILGHDKAVAVGEIGLDYHYCFSPKDRQKEIFARQLALAGALGLPVVVHDREAHADVVDLLRAHRNVLKGGVCHCFSGDRRLAEQVLELGFYISFGGSLTFRNSHELAEAAKYAPADRILLETDCPYLSPAPHRGKRNDSSRLVIIAGRLAEIRGAGIGDIAETTANNAERLFSLHEI